MSRGMFFYNEAEERSPSNEADHVAESCCYLCARSFFEDSEIFMYRNEQFCTDDCRQEQIEFDEAKEEKKKVKKVVALRRSESEQAINSSDVRHGSIEVA